MKRMPADFAHVLRMCRSYMFNFKLLHNFLFAFKLRFQRGFLLNFYMLGSVCRGLPKSLFKLVLK